MASITDITTDLELRKQQFLEKYSFLLTGCTYFLLIVLLGAAIWLGMKDLIYLLAGVVINNGLKDAAGFWFGSSLNSRDKDKAIATLTTQTALNPQNPVNTVTLSEDELTELATLQATANRTPDQETRLQELLKKQNSSNV